MKVLYIAEIVGKAGVYALKKGLSALKQRHTFDFIIAGADGVTGGNGLGKNHAAYIHKLGVNVLSVGECGFYKKDLVENWGKISYVLRPDNLSPAAPGLGSRIFRIDQKKIAVATLLGQSGFNRTHGDNPALLLPVLLERFHQETPYIVLDFHAQTTAEKRALFFAADGHCSAVIGSHTRVQTADETVLSGGTAVITDAGRTGSADSVGGVDPAERIQEYLTGIPDRTKETWSEPELQGVIIDIADDGKARSITRVRERVPPAQAKETREENADSSEARE
ncbi:MAG: YmdB family metallophosphoesterase [Treponema sp.]|jgi:metallophosphoesterase (TIGR00282 family)|nr:YmdB family metallophosphoesterase [Treponema sp.]